MTRLTRLAAVALALVGAGGCSTTYHAAMEQLGWAKRDILVDRLQGARNSQDDAKTAFADALQRLRAVAAVQGGALEHEYAASRSAYDEASQGADEARTRVAAVPPAAGALFTEWRGELAEITDARLRARSQERYQAAQRRYDRVLAAMQRADAAMTPVLATLQDQVLLLQHTRTPETVAGLRSALTAIAADVDTLAIALENAIAEADQFITQLERGE